MALKLSRCHRRQLLDWADEAGDNECCGLLLGRDLMVERVQQAINVAPDPTKHFEVDPLTLIEAEKAARAGGPQILGYFHSHPNGLSRPSSHDAASAAADGRYWLIIANGEITCWQPVSCGQGLPVEFHANGPCLGLNPAAAKSISAAAANRGM